jgi:general secretion pathway protein L
LKRRAFIRLMGEPEWVAHVQSREIATPVTLPVEWRVVPPVPDQVSQGTCALDALASHLETLDPGLYDLTAVLVLGGENCFGADVNIPSKQTRQIVQALPFMLEDQLAEEVDAFVFTPGPRSKEGKVSVLATSRALLAGLSSAFREAGIPLEAVVPDMLGLPRGEGQWSFVCDEKMLNIRTGDLSGLTIEMDALPVVSAAMIREGEPAPRQARISFTHRQLGDSMQAWLRTQFTNMVAGHDVELLFDQASVSRFDFLVEGFASQGALPANLLPPDLRAGPRRRQSNLRWKPAAAMVGICALLQTTLLYAEGWKMRQQTTAINAETIALYKRYFPQDRTVLDVRRQMTDKFRQAEKQSSGASFLVLLAMTGQIINETNRGKPAPDLSLQRINYDEAQGDIRIDLKAQGYSALDGMKAKVEQTGLGMEISSASQDGEQVKARVRIWSRS